MKPLNTPLPLKVLLFATIGLSLLSPWLGNLFSLSLAGIEHLYLWQFITYAFTHPAPLGITFPYLLSLALSMYILWTFGASLIERIKTAPFFTLYFSSILIGGLLSFGAMSLLHLPQFYASTAPPLYAILVAWTMLNPEAELRLFFAIPFKANWLLLGLMGANLLISLSNSDWPALFSDLGTFVYAYLFSLIAFRARSSFSFLNSWETMVLRTLENLRHLGKKGKEFRPTKIYDFKTGDPVLADDQFMDAMLARISLHGEESLTPEERKRMQQISERKSRGKK